MNESSNLMAWPTCPGYVTVRPLNDLSDCKIWLMRRDSDQNYMVLKLCGDAENICSLRQTQVEATRKYVVDFYGTISTQLGDGLLMEYCPGGSLAQLLVERPPFTLGESITALAPIAQTLAALHLSGQRHGDVSASNILLTAHGMPKLGDFQDSAPSFSEGSGAGTPGFMAPEVCLGSSEQQLGEQDVYSLGACLWFLLDGKAPPDPSSRPPVRMIFPDVPELIHELLLDSLHEDPTRRPTAGEFARTLFASAQAQAINWAHCTPEISTHLMATIHPAPQHRSRRQRRKLTPNVAAPYARSAESEWHVPKLKHTPGRNRVMAASGVGAALLALSVLGVNAMGGTLPAFGEKNQAPQIEPSSCKIQDGGNEPGCAWNADVVIANFIRLSEARDKAMRNQNLKALAKIYPADSEQLSRDQQTMDKLKDLGLRLEGLNTHLAEIAIIARGKPDTVVLAALSTQGAYAYVDAGDRVVHEVAQGNEERIEVELKLVEGQWKIGKVISRGI